jgi:hypothetical protein
VESAVSRGAEAIGKQVRGALFIGCSARESGTSVHDYTEAAAVERDFR